MSQSHYTVTWTGPIHRVLAEPGLTLTRNVPKETPLTLRQLDKLKATAGIAVEPVTSIASAPDLSLKLRAAADKALVTEPKPSGGATATRTDEEAKKPRKSTTKKEKE